MSQDYILFVFVLNWKYNLYSREYIAKLLYIFPLYLACQSGRYGLSCAKACGQNCQGCNRFNGVCEFGCHPGWKGTFCEKRSNNVFRYFLSCKQLSAQNPYCITTYASIFCTCMNTMICYSLF